MPCYHPLKAFVLGQNENGKKNLKICSFQVDHIEKRLGDDRLVCSTSPVPTDCHLPYVYFTEFIQIPCGKCVGCRLDYSRQWANRCMLELEYHDSAYFVTLTYDDQHAPVSYYPDPSTGEAFEALTLCKRDFQLFMKRLRKQFCDDHIRFFAAGEYGSTTARPHYHAIIFGLHLNDLELYKKSLQGYKYYNSPSFQRCWPQGFAVVGEVTWDTCAYTARYVMKKLNGNLSQFYDDFNLEPEFSLMSRKPGIAWQFFQDHKDQIYEHDQINISTPKGGRKFRPPRYYDNLFDLDDPVMLDEVKQSRRRTAERLQAARAALSDLSYEDQLFVDEQAKQNQIKSLKRSVI